MQLQTCEIVENTRGENLAAGQWNGIDHNVCRWSRTGQNDQRFVLWPRPNGKHRLMSLREDAFARGRSFVGVVPDSGNAILWGKSDDASQLFEIEERGGGMVSFRESTRGEFLDVDARTGNIQRWSGHDRNTPKSNQLFRLSHMDTRDIDPALFTAEHRELAGPAADIMAFYRLGQAEVNFLASIPADGWQKIGDTLRGMAGFDRLVDRVKAGDYLTVSEFAHASGPQANEYNDFQRALDSILTALGLVVAGAIIGAAVICAILALVGFVLIFAGAPHIGIPLFVICGIAAICLALFGGVMAWWLIRHLMGEF